MITETGWVVSLPSGVLSRDGRGIFQSSRKGKSQVRANRATTAIVMLFR
jgi:hypothetical protein